MKALNGTPHHPGIFCSMMDEVHQDELWDALEASQKKEEERKGVEGMERKRASPAQGGRLKENHRSTSEGNRSGTRIKSGALRQGLELPPLLDL